MCESKHPTCPECGRRLVYVAMVVGPYMFQTWQCDCYYREDEEFCPPSVISDIVRSREWDDGSMVYDVDIVMEYGNSDEDWEDLDE